MGQHLRPLTSAWGLARPHREAVDDAGIRALPRVAMGFTRAGLCRRVREATLPNVAESATSKTLDYRLAAAGRESAEEDRLGLLEQIYDPLSRRRRSLVQPAWRCLEVGAGRGSMAVWLAERVGPSGHVVAADIDTRYLERLDLPNLQVIKHNILEDPLEVLGPGSFDLVCSRLMLFHLKGVQEQAIRQMVECLRPGGWLVDEDADWGTAAPVDPAHPRYADYQRVWRNGDWWATRGYDQAFGQKLPALFERCGLQDIRDEASTEVVRGGSPWARWWIPTLEVINELGGGDEASRREVEMMTGALADPTVWLQREVLHACWGRRAL
jgi:SAM-dependent methyltransferase